ncbi:MAG: YlxM family DNA-binding protein [Anaerovoracaceae bacterium]|jgi:predicted DNA-binding protein YlxM (UPF0122 family)
MLDETLKYSLLLDYYGGLLTERQREVTRLYHDENLSLAEIAEEFGISRQGVHDALKNAEAALLSYEEKLGLAKTIRRRERAIEKIDGMIDDLIAEKAGDGDLRHRLKDIKKVIDNLDESGE